MLELIFALLLALKTGQMQLTSIGPGEKGEIDTQNPDTGKGVVFHAFGHHYEIKAIMVERAPELSPVPPKAPVLPALEDTSETA